MKKYPDTDGILYICGPLLLYMIVNMVAGSLMETVWLYGPGRDLLAGRDAADSYTILGVWSLLCMIIPTGAGCLCIRREAFRSTAAFARKRNQGRQLPTAGLSILFVAVVCLALGINLVFSLCTGPAELSSGFPAALPGPAGFAAAAIVYGVFMPFIEESLFRGILFSRMIEVLAKRHRTTGLVQDETGESRILPEDVSAETHNAPGRLQDETGESQPLPKDLPEGECGTHDWWMAVLLSSALFGLYHGTVFQGIYAFAMGIVFAEAYGQTGRFSVPWGLHGACNLCILLLQWTDRYRALCTPAWAAAFFSLAAAGFYTLWQMQKNAA